MGELVVGEFECGQFDVHSSTRYDLGKLHDKAYHYSIKQVSDIYAVNV